METFGNQMYDAITIVAEMAAIGMGLPSATFTDRLKGGPHLLAPTGSDLEKNKLGAVFAGLHNDISFLTIHGKSKYPGLSVWTRDWKKTAAKIPPGCLLVQSGQTFEYLTGGYVHAGYHEVVYNEGTKNAYEERKSSMGDRPQWRVSSTLFSMCRNDARVDPLKEIDFLHQNSNGKTYETPFTAHQLLMRELDANGLSAETCVQIGEAKVGGEASPTKSM